MSTSDSSTPSPDRHMREAVQRMTTIMGFQTVWQFQAFIGSQAILDAFNEFQNDYLVVYHQNEPFAEPEFHRVTNSIGAYDALGHANPRYNRYAVNNPNKSTWEVRHHFARFIVQAYNGARDSGSDWSGLTDDLAEAYYKLYELLLFLAQRWLAENVGDGM